VDLWLAPTLAPGDRWIATLRHIVRENRMFVIGVNPVLHADQIPAGFPHRDRLVPARISTAKRTATGSRRQHRHHRAQRRDPRRAGTAA
jgi:hypothetical protein